jgi:hypothetical protein
VDGLNASNFADRYFSIVRAAGVTVTIPTVAWIENLSESIKLVADWYSKIRRNEDVAVQGTTMNDIKRAKEEGKVAYLYSPFRTRIRSKTESNYSTYFTNSEFGWSKSHTTKKIRLVMDAERGPTPDSAISAWN